jgi:hypothetical protein
MKHRTTAAMMLAVAFAAMVFHFASAAVNLRRRGFTSGEALGAIGTTLTIAVVPCCAAIVILRAWNRRQTRQPHGNSEKLITERLTQASCPAPAGGSGPPLRPR